MNRKALSCLIYFGLFIGVPEPHALANSCDGFTGLLAPMLPDITANTRAAELGALVNTPEKIHEFIALQGHHYFGTQPFMTSLSTLTPEVRGSVLDQLRNLTPFRRRELLDRLQDIAYNQQLKRLAQNETSALVLKAAETSSKPADAGIIALGQAPLQYSEVQKMLEGSLPADLIEAARNSWAAAPASIDPELLGKVLDDARSWPQSFQRHLFSKVLFKLDTAENGKTSLIFVASDSSAIKSLEYQLSAMLITPKPVQTMIDFAVRNVSPGTPHLREAALEFLSHPIFYYKTYFATPLPDKADLFEFAIQALTASKNKDSRINQALAQVIKDGRKIVPKGNTNPQVETAMMALLARGEKPSSLTEIEEAIRNGNLALIRDFVTLHATGALKKAWNNEVDLVISTIRWQGRHKDRLFTNLVSDPDSKSDALKFIEAYKITGSELQAKLRELSKTDPELAIRRRAVRILRNNPFKDSVQNPIQKTP